MRDQSNRRRRSPKPEMVPYDPLYHQRRYFFRGVRLADAVLREADRYIATLVHPVANPAVFDGIFGLVDFAIAPSGGLNSRRLGKLFDKHCEACLKFSLRLLLNTESALKEFIDEIEGQGQQEAVLKSFCTSPRFPDVAGVKQRDLSIYHELRDWLESPAKHCRSLPCAKALEADRVLCLNLLLNLRHYIGELPQLKRCLFEEREILLPNGKFISIGMATTKQISLHMEKQCHVKHCSLALINKYIRWMDAIAKSIPDLYFKYTILSQHYEQAFTSPVSAQSKAESVFRVGPWKPR